MDNKRNNNEIPVQHSTQTPSDQSPVLSDTPVGQTIAQILDIPSLSKEQVEIKAETVTDVTGLISQKERDWLLEAAVPVVKELSESQEFQKAAFTDPLLRQKLGTTGLIPLQADDGAIVVASPTGDDTTPETIMQRYEKTKSQKGFWRRVSDVVTGSAKWVLGTIKNAVLFLKNKVVTFFTFLYDNIHVISWVITTLLMIKRLICDKLSRTLSITILKPSQVTWFYRLHQFVKNWILPVAHVSWPALQQYFVDAAPSVIDKLGNIADIATKAAKAVGVETSPSGEDSGVATSTAASEAAVSTYVNKELSEFVDASASLIPYYASIKKWLSTVGPFIKLAGPYILTTIKLGVTAGHLKELITGNCVQLQVQFTSNLLEATHSMSLECLTTTNTTKSAKTSTTATPLPSPSPSPQSCKQKDKVIRFTPDAEFDPQEKYGTVIGKLYTYLFPPNGQMDVSITELSRWLDVPPEFLDMETESFQVLQAEMKQVEERQRKELSNDAYEAYCTLTQMLDLLVQNRIPTVTVDAAMQAEELLKKVVIAVKNGQVIWQFQNQWQNKFDRLVRRIDKASEDKASENKASENKASEDRGSASASVTKTAVTSDRRPDGVPVTVVQVEKKAVQSFFAELTLALKQETRLHGANSPKALYLTFLYEKIQTIMLTYKIEELPKSFIDGVQEAIDRYREGHATGSYCLYNDEDYLTLMEPYLTKNPVLPTLYEQLSALIKQNKGWFGLGLCNRERDTSRIPRPQLYVAAQQNLSELWSQTEKEKAKCDGKEMKALLDQLEPLRNWNLYNRLHKELSQHCKTGGGRRGGSDSNVVRRRRHIVQTAISWNRLSNLRFASLYPFSPSQ